MVIVIDYKKCCWKDGKCSSGCGTKCGCNSGACEGCVEACPFGAIERKKFIEVDEKKCIDCGICVSSCKHGAISLD